MWKCKHCQKEFDFSTVPQKSNHTRWCKENPSPSYKNLADKRKAEGIEYVSPLKGEKK